MWYVTSVSVGCGVGWVWCVVCHFCKCWMWSGCGMGYATSVSVGCGVGCLWCVICHFCKCRVWCGVSMVCGMPLL